MKRRSLIHSSISDPERRNVDKFADIPLKKSENGLPYIEDGHAALFRKVVSKLDLGSHTMFIAEVTEGEVISDDAPATYDYYHKHIKKAPEKSKGWVCRICGYVYEGDLCRLISSALYASTALPIRKKVKAQIPMTYVSEEGRIYHRPSFAVLGGFC